MFYLTYYNPEMKKRILGTSGLKREDAAKLYKSLRNNKDLDVRMHMIGDLLSILSYVMVGSDNTIVNKTLDEMNLVVV